MDTYTIKKAYHWTDTDEIEIKSENLLYAELEYTHHGCQCTNFKNKKKILKKCLKVAKLIKDIDRLNKV